MKNQTVMEGKKYQGLSKVYEFDKKEGSEAIKKDEKDGDKKPILKNMNN